MILSFLKTVGIIDENHFVTDLNLYESHLTIKNLNLLDFGCYLCDVLRCLALF